MICAYCKKEFTPAYGSSIYCCDECARKGGNFKKRKRMALARGLTEEEAQEYAEHGEKMKICARFGCDNQFFPANNRQKYCSELCARIDKQQQLRTWKRNKKKYAAYRMDKPIFVNRLIHDLNIRGASLRR